MTNMPVLIAIFIGLTVFMIGLIIAVFSFKKQEERTAKIERRKANPWLFSNFDEVVYNAFFRFKDPDDVARKFAIKPEKYYASCELTGTKPNIKKVIAHHIYAIAILIVGIILAIVLSPIALLVALGLFVLLCVWETQKLSSKANAQKKKVSEDLPDFLDLLKTELAVGIPIETAIPLLCRKLPDSLLAQELLMSMQDMHMGASTWQEALEKVANKYDDESLTNFVMDVTTSYRKGTSAYASVARQATEIRQDHILKVKEDAAKMETRILVPIAVLQIMPLLAFLLIPTFLQVTEWVLF